MNHSKYLIASKIRRSADGNPPVGFVSAGADEIVGTERELAAPAAF